MSDCLFCKIINGDIPSAEVYSDEHVYAFKDLHPQAPIHHLIVPRVHYDDILALHEAGEAAVVMSQVMDAVANLAKQEGIYDRGFRLVNNCREEGGQTIKHLHFHLLGGEKLDESSI